MAAIAGGLAASAAGGKFANGAVSAAFAHLFNNEGASAIQEKRDVEPLSREDAEDLIRSLSISERRAFVEDMFGQIDIAYGVYTRLINSGEYGYAQAWSDLRAMRLIYGIDLVAGKVIELPPRVVALITGPGKGTITKFVHEVSGVVADAVSPASISTVKGVLNCSRSGCSVNVYAY